MIQDDEDIGPALARMVRMEFDFPTGGVTRDMIQGARETISRMTEIAASLAGNAQTSLRSQIDEVKAAVDRAEARWFPPRQAKPKNRRTKGPARSDGPVRRRSSRGYKKP